MKTTHFTDYPFHCHGWFKNKIADYNEATVKVKRQDTMRYTMYKNSFTYLVLTSVKYFNIGTYIPHVKI